MSSEANLTPAADAVGIHKTETFGEQREETLEIWHRKQNDGKILS